MNMADAIAVLILGLQYSLIVLFIDLYFPKTIPVSVAIGVFLVFATIAIAVLHGKKAAARNAAAWGLLALLSVFLGITFLGGDWLVAFLNGESSLHHFAGGLLGLPLTILVCPCGTMVCVAGSVRALYIRRT
jgi:hypothetical protein